MAPIPFSKLNGSGNDFILIDNRQGRLSKEDLPQIARKLCQRRFSVGADGLIAIEKSEQVDFRWRFFNADGSVAEMCGNGGRCAARFAYERGIAGPQLCFETLAGNIQAEVSGARIRLELPPPNNFRPQIEIPLLSGNLQADFIDTGVPHIVISPDEVETIDVKTIGQEIRRHALFKPAGTNVNFIQRQGSSEIKIRTYERGVEAETMACGTGAVAGALIGAHNWDLHSPVTVQTQGGEILAVHFSNKHEGFKEVFLEGDTCWVYDGQCTDEAWGRPQ